MGKRDEKDFGECLLLWRLFGSNWTTIEAIFRAISLSSRQGNHIRFCVISFHRQSHRSWHRSVAFSFVYDLGHSIWNHATFLCILPAPHFVSPHLHGMHWT